MRHIPFQLPPHLKPRRIRIRIHVLPILHILYVIPVLYTLHPLAMGRGPHMDHSIGILETPIIGIHHPHPLRIMPRRHLPVRTASDSWRPICDAS